jgi:C-terminal processing protease CtpA/Prc
LPGGPADEAGIEVGAVITEINGEPVDDFVDNTVAWSGPFSTNHVRRLQQLRYATRAPLGSQFEITFQNPDADESETVTLDTVSEGQSFSQSSFNVGTTGFELPVEYHLIDGTPYLYAAITSFADNDVLSIQLWERMLQAANQQGVGGIIIDMRKNSGGSGFLADQMAAYFFEEELTLGNTGTYDESIDDFYFDPRYEDQFYLPDQSLRYDGPVAVLVGPNCISACEFFSYDMTLQDRAAIVGQYPTAGGGGSVNQLLMPGGEYFSFTVGRALGPDGEIDIEGKGVAPTVQVPVTLETIQAIANGEDPILDAAIAHLDEATAVETTDGGEIAVGDEVEGDIPDGGRISFALPVEEGQVLDITAFADDDGLDTYLRVYDTDGNLLLENDDLESPDTDAGFDDLEIPADMTLHIEVASYGDEQGGAFTLVVEAQ